MTKKQTRIPNIRILNLIHIVNCSPLPIKTLKNVVELPGRSITILLILAFLVKQVYVYVYLIIKS